MGRVIHASAAAGKVIRDVIMTLAVAEATNPDLFADAERYLADSVARAADVDRQIEENASSLLRARAQLQAGSERCNDLINSVRDEFFNTSGRASRDPIFTRIFAGGARRYTAFPARQKPISLEMLASALETHRHRWVSDEVVQEMAGRLRTEAATLREIVATLEPIEVEARLLKTHRTANAQAAQRQLAALKRFWLGEGMAEAEVHEVIPSRTPPRRSTPASETEDPLPEMDPAPDASTELSTEPSTEATAEATTDDSSETEAA